jgi:hypothetical protein
MLRRMLRVSLRLLPCEEEEEEEEEGVWKVLALCAVRLMVLTIRAAVFCARTVLTRGVA